MRYFVFSDLHGSASALKKALALPSFQKADRILLLGDILRGGYEGASSECAALLKENKDRILAVRGNCDDESDAETLGFPLPEFRGFSLGMHRVHLSHRPQVFSFPPGDIVMNGHTHRKTLYRDAGVIYVNPGSIAYPRDGVASYAVMDENGIRLHALEDHSVLLELHF